MVSGKTKDELYESIGNQILSAKEKYEAAPTGTLVFVWGKGFVSNGIRLFQKFESIETAHRLSIERAINFNLNMPTHVEVKVDLGSNVSAEFKGLEKVDFKRLLDKGVGIIIAKPKITTNEDTEFQFKLRKFLLSKVGTTPYDFWGFSTFIYRILRFVFKWDKIKDSDWKFAEICSEISLRGYSEIDGGRKFIDMKEDPSKVSPEELYLKCCNCENMEIEILVSPDEVIESRIDKENEK